MKRKHTEKEYKKLFTMYESLTRKQRVMFKNLEHDTRKFEVTEDRQYGSFGMYRVYTIQEWIDTALEWLDSDGYFEEDQIFVNYLLKGGIRAIKAIDEFWDITLERVTKQKRYLIKELNKKVCSMTEANDIMEKHYELKHEWLTIIDLKKYNYKGERK